MKWKNQILDFRAYRPGKSIEEVKKEYDLESIVKLASNKNPYGHSPHVDQALAKIDSSFMRYPDGNASRIREATASLLDVSEDQLIFSNGTDELIGIISRALLEPGKNTVMATPTFPQYKHSAIIEGSEVREVSLTNGSHNLDAMFDAIDENTAIVWICNPNNPTGTLIPDSGIRLFIERVPGDVLVVLDEAYFEYVTESYDTLPLVEKHPNLVIMRTFSKAYGLASFRVGYGIASPSTIRHLEPIRLPFNTNVLGQIAATAAVADQAFVQTCHEKNSLELEKYYTFCNEMELDYFPSQGNFILINFHQDGDEVAEFLLSKGLIVRSGKALGFPTSVRITVGDKHQNELVRKAIRELRDTGTGTSSHKLLYSTS